MIDSIQICKFFLHNMRPVEQQEFSRSRDVQEHVDTASPELTVSNWTETPEQTLGFVSIDGGESWQRLTEDLGSAYCGAPSRPWEASYLPSTRGTTTRLTDSAARDPLTPAPLPHPTRVRTGRTRP